MKDYSVLDGMRKQTSEIIMQAFDKGYKQGYMDGKDETYKNPVPTQDAYQRGLDDAWEAARWIDDSSSATIVDVFGCSYEAFKCTASEAIAKIKEYEEKQNNRCSFCIHCEMCGWIEARKNCGCDCFDDGKMQEDNE